MNASTAAPLPEPHPMIMLPFAAMLLCIAFAPLILKHHWERHYHRVSLALAAITCGYYLLVLQNAERVRHAALDYFSFMSVVASLFVVAGGIHIRVKGEARPAVNALFLFIGALLANVIGTTGASMLLIRPWISMNRYRFTGLHTAFFIFVVSNIGGALLPVGPPLFLGYMKGVPFLWAMQRCCLQWSITLAAVLLAFYFIDRQNYRRAPRKLRREKTASENWRFDGLQNVAFMAAILGALIFAPFGWRELIMIAAAAAAYVSTPAKIHSANDFTFAPVREVAWLFLGIFGTMVPVLAYMESHAAQLGLHSDLQFFWLSGVLSALLDNAPTYLTFLAAALGLHGLDIDNAQQVGRFVSDHDHYLVAISLGATFFGALTYIGNGPNFMVKAIAQHAHVHTPTFFGYLFKFALPVLLPIFVLISLFFFVR